MQCPHCFREISTTGACPFCGYDGTEQAEQYPLALRPGSILNGRYILGRVLGQGGFGITYIAQDYQTGGRVAIKEYLPTDFAGRTAGAPSVQIYSGARAENFAFGMEKFLEEAKTLAAFIGNRNIVRIYSYFEENGTAYFSMEYVDGLPLDKYMAAHGGRLSPAEADRLLLPLMEALEQVHLKGIVHRDIAPDNILIDRDGTAKLIDFGAARYSTGEKSKSLDVVLKNGFAPYEQYMRRGRQGPWTDVYALAATYYYAVTGKVPPEAVERRNEDELIPPSTLGVKLSGEQEEALLKALEVLSADRFQSMAEFRRAMSDAAPKAGRVSLRKPVPEPEPEAAAPKASPVSLRKPARPPEPPPVSPAPEPAQPPAGKKQKLPLLLAAAAVLALVIFGAVKLARGGGDKTESPAAAETPAPVTSETPAPTEAPALSALEANAGKYGIVWMELTPEYMDSALGEGYKAKAGVGSRRLKPETREDYYVELNADGTGYLYLGDDNQGPVDRWEIDGEKLRFQAGVSVFDCTLNKGVIRAEVEDGFYIWFAAPGAELPTEDSISMDDYVSLLYGEQLRAENRGLPGEYHVYAMEYEGWCVRIDDPEILGEEDMYIVLDEDGTGRICIEGEDNAFRWEQNGDEVTLYDVSSEVSYSGMMELEPLSEGVFRFSIPSENIALIYTRDGADVSGIETISIEEFQALLDQA